MSLGLKKLVKLQFTYFVNKINIIFLTVCPASCAIIGYEQQLLCQNFEWIPPSSTIPQTTTTSPATPGFHLIFGML